jgi:hypothetical protein
MAAAESYGADRRSSLVGERARVSSIVRAFSDQLEGYSLFRRPEKSGFTPHPDGCS